MSREYRTNDEFGQGRSAGSSSFSVRTQGAVSPGQAYRTPDVAGSTPTSISPLTTILSSFNDVYKGSPAKQDNIKINWGQPAAATIKGSPELFQQLIVRRDDLPLHLDENERHDVITPFAQFFADKGFAPAALEYLANRGVLDNLFSNLALRQNASSAARPFFSGFKPHVLSAAFELQERGSWNGYRGTSGENAVIDSSIAESEAKLDSRRRVSGRGATRRFELGNILRIGAERIVGETPVIIIGGGPAGLMAVREMIAIGFSSRNITVIEKSGEYGGIWKQKNVVNGTKNNPFPFDFDRVGLEAAPGPGTTVSTFLGELENGRVDIKIPTPIKGVVTSVEPGDLHHRVTYRTADGEHTIAAPIVINAIGTGKPLSPNREGIMTTDTPEKAGIRWQQILTLKQAERYRGKTLIFVGLGNSTIEMLQQIQEFNRRGFNIDYRVITHYPAQAVENPTTQFVEHGKSYQVFRDITAPNLTKVEGDLPHANAAYFEALNSGKIIPDVTHWHSEEGIFTATTRGGSQQKINFAQQFTLIGYVHEADMLRRMGMHVNDELLGEVSYDYDGEIQRRPGVAGRNRIYPGYFGLGAVLKTRDNPNAIVMPGIMHRMYDMLFSAAVRATEYKVRMLENQQLLRLSD